MRNGRGKISVRLDIAQGVSPLVEAYRDSRCVTIYFVGDGGDDHEGFRVHLDEKQAADLRQRLYEATTISERRKTR